MKKTLILPLLLLSVLLSACGNIEPSVTSATEYTAETTTKTPTQSSTHTPISTNTPETEETSKEQTSASNEKYTSVTQIPKIYRIEKKNLGARESAAHLARMMLDDMCTQSDERAFVFSYYKLSSVYVVPSSKIESESRYEELNKELIAPNTSIVHVNFDFCYSGEYTSLGEGDDATSHEFRAVEEDVPLIFMETNEEYLLWWSSAFGENNYPEEIKAHIGEEILPPAQTEPEPELYWTITYVPGIYRIEKGDMTPEDAALVLTEEMLAEMGKESPDRTFVILEYRNLQIELSPSAEFFGLGAPESPLVSDNSYFLSMQAEFRYSGIYNPIGESYDESKWWPNIRSGGRLGNLLILLETENEYLMWWQNAYPPSGIPEEAADLLG